jgi:hypothetical protein
VTDDDWEEQRNRAILAAFQTGRTVFADTDGELRFADGNQEAVPEDVGRAASPLPGAQTLASRAERWSRRAFVMSAIAALGNGIASIWHPWQLAVAAVFVGCAFIWRGVNRSQRKLLKQAVRP